MDELDELIEEMALEISKQYGTFEAFIYNQIIGHKGEIKDWLKKNKKKINRALKKL